MIPMSVPHRADRPCPSRTGHDLHFRVDGLKRVLADQTASGGPILLIGDDHGVYVITEDDWGALGEPVFAIGCGPVALADTAQQGRLRKVTGSAGFRGVLNPAELASVTGEAACPTVLFRVLAWGEGDRVVTGPYPAGNTSRP